MASLPDDIVFDVLSRVPIVFLCRFKCVSRSWRSLISHPCFITIHLNRVTNNEHERLVLHDDYRLCTVDLEPSRFGAESVAVPLKFPLQPKWRRWTKNPRRRDVCRESCGSCDGLLLAGLERPAGVNFRYFFWLTRLPENP